MGQLNKSSEVKLGNSLSQSVTLFPSDCLTHLGCLQGNSSTITTFLKEGVSEHFCSTFAHIGAHSSTFLLKFLVRTRESIGMCLALGKALFALSAA